jgi:hypothetical protein
LSTTDTRVASTHAEERQGYWDPRVGFKAKLVRHRPLAWAPLTRALGARKHYQRNIGSIDGKATWLRRCCGKTTSAAGLKLWASDRPRRRAPHPTRPVLPPQRRPILFMDAAAAKTRLLGQPYVRSRLANGPAGTSGERGAMSTDRSPGSQTTPKLNHIVNI